MASPQAIHSPFPSCPHQLRTSWNVSTNIRLDWALLRISPPGSTHVSTTSSLFIWERLLLLWTHWSNLPLVYCHPLISLLHHLMLLVSIPPWVSPSLLYLHSLVGFLSNFGVLGSKFWYPVVYLRGIHCFLSQAISSPRSLLTLFPYSSFPRCNSTKSTLVLVFQSQSSALTFTSPFLTTVDMSPGVAGDRELACQKRMLIIPSSYPRASSNASISWLAFEWLTFD